MLLKAVNCGFGHSYLRNPSWKTSFLCSVTYRVRTDYVRFKVNLDSIVAWMSRTLAENRHDIWSLSDSNGIQTYNHLLRKRLRTKWLWVRIPLSLILSALCSVFSFDKSQWTTFKNVQTSSWVFFEWSQTLAIIVINMK